jgi:hypothetical protein
MLINYRNGKSFWSAFKSLNYVPRFINNISKSDWFKHYKNVFLTPTDYTPITIEIPREFEPDPILDAELNVFEVKLAIKRLKTNKAPGKDSVPNEIWKLSTPVLLPFFLLSFRPEGSYGMIPVVCPCVPKFTYK